jgi:hypothetical protein
MPTPTLTFFVGFWMLCLFGASPLQSSDTVKGKQASQRIVFPAGKSSSVVSGKVVHGNSNRYVLRAKANQKMTFLLHSKESNAVVELYTPKGGLIGFLAEIHQWSGWLPISGDHLVVVGATQGTANYRLKIAIENDPGRMARQAQSAGDQDVCTFIAEMANRDKEKELFSDFNPEIKLGGGKALLDKLGISEEDRLRRFWDWDYATSVDLDNDGIEELRFQFWAGGAHCEHNEFFKKNINGEYASNILDPMLHEGGWLCSGNGLRFLRYKNTSYLLHISVHRYVPKEITVYLFTEALNLDLKCAIEIYSNEVEAKSDCSEPICEAIKKWIEGSLQPEAWVPIHGTEQPIEDIEAVPIDWDSLKPWMRDGKFFFIDVDNDGINEVFAKKKAPPAERLFYSILKMQDGIYRAIIPA